MFALFYYHIGNFFFNKTQNRKEFRNDNEPLYFFMVCYFLFFAHLTKTEEVL